MAIRVPSSTEPYATLEVPLSGVTYLLTYRYNSRSKRWKLDIALADNTPVKNGLSMIEGFFPTSYLTLPEFSNGEIGVIRMNSTDELCSRDNFGIGKDYTLGYASYEELGIS